MPSGEEMVAKIQRDFAVLGPFKGISRFSQERNGIRQSGRAAFGVAPPDRLRVEILNPFGQPMVSLASNGPKVFLYTRIEDKFRSGAASRSMMNNALGIDMTIGELAYVLAGFPPVADHKRIRIEPWIPEGETAPVGYAVTLLSAFYGVREKIWISEDRSAVRRADVYGFGNVLYSVLFSPKEEGKVKVVGKDGAAITLERQQFWENSPVDESQFVLIKDMEESR